MENDTSHSAIIDALVSELAAGELRAKRSLRILEHQEDRISTLENELCGKSNMLQELQQSHADLMEVRRYQAEVQELQKQLIKMQEIQYLTEVVQPKIDENINNNDERESHTNQETFRQGVLNLNDRKLNSPKYSQRALFKSYTTGEGGSSDDTPNSIRNGKSATDNAILRDEENRSSLKSGLGCMASLLQNSSKRNFVQSPPPAAENDGRNSCFACSRKIGASENEQRFKMHAHQTSTSYYDDDDEPISILKETLSFHRQSIENLSTEVVHLRKERSELLSYVQNLLEWKSKVESDLENVGESKTAHYENSIQKDSFSNKEIDVIMPASEQSYQRSMNDSGTLLRNKTQSRHVRLNLKTLGSNANKISVMERQLDRETGSKLELRARRLWDTACRFFTPQQAHFILTAPIPCEEEGESSFAEDNY